MKRIISILLTLALLMGILCSFSGVSGTEQKYSGGSGTEDDPYLISTRSDIHELRKSIVDAKFSWGQKLYYKLTNDITVGYKGDYISPLYKASDDLIEELEGYHWANTSSGRKTCYLSTTLARGINATDLQVRYDYSNAIISSEIIVGYRGEDEYTEEFRRRVAEEWGPMYFSYGIYHSSESGEISAFNNGTKKMETLDDFFFYQSFTEINHTHSYRDSPEVSAIIRTVVFSGVFDGNGHTLTFAENKANGNYQYLFGFLENGAEIKNLTIKGNDAHLAAYVGESCKITNCTFGEENDKSAYDAAPIARNLGTVKGCKNYMRNPEGIVGQNDGVISNCINYGDIAAGNLCKYGDGEIKGCLDFSDSIRDDIEGVMTRAEQETLKDDIATYLDAGFDFENIWMMVGGYPVLKSTVSSNCGDINADGVINSIDANLMKRYLGGAPLSYAYVLPASADLDMDGKITAKDSYFLKCYMARN